MRERLLKEMDDFIYNYPESIKKYNTKSQNSFYKLLLLKLIYDKLCEFEVNCIKLDKDNNEI